VSDIEYDELAERLGTVPVIDVRTPHEHSGEAGYPCCGGQGHIPESRNIPVDELFGRSPEELRELVGEPEGAELVVYCHSGGRSSRAAAMLREAGYNARNYGGSWHEWSHRHER
jgi:thiosulfate/3-mercaptopyruvate sulfurtransferase